MINPVGPSEPHKNDDVSSKYLQNSKKVSASDEQKDVPKEKIVSQKDEVVLSPLARDVQHVKKAAESESAERASVIDKIREEVQQGQYQVDATEIAQKMVDDGTVDELP